MPRTKGATSKKTVSGPCEDCGDTVTKRKAVQRFLCEPCRGRRRRRHANPGSEPGRPGPPPGSRFPPRPGRVPWLVGRGASPPRYELYMTQCGGRCHCMVPGDPGHGPYVRVRWVDETGHEQIKHVSATNKEGMALAREAGLDLSKVNGAES